MNMPGPLRSQRRSTVLAGLSLLGMAGCTPVRGPRLVPLPAVSRPEPAPRSQRRAEREALLRASHTHLISLAAAHQQLANQSALAERIRHLAIPLRSAVEAIRADSSSTSWPIDVVVTGEGADVIPLLPASLVLVIDADHPVVQSGDLLSALIAHGLAHGLRDHALEADGLIDGLPQFSLIQEREADRDTCEILARAGLEPMLAWHLRKALVRAADGSTSNGLTRPARTDPFGAGQSQQWARRHPAPPRAQQSIESFAARVEPLRAAAAAVR